MKRAQRWFVRVLGVLAIAALLALVFRAPVPIGEFAILKPPERPPRASWQRAGVEQLVVRGAGGTALRGWIVPGRRGRPWLVMCYGNAGSAASTLGLARWFTSRLGFTTVLWDYRGYGFSDGRTDALAMRDDAVRVYDDVARRSGSAPAVYGLSFGTTMAVHIAAQRNVRALVLHAPPSSAVTEMTWFRDRYVPWPLNRLTPLPTRSVRIALDVEREIGGVHAPLLVLHGDADELIPIDEGRAVERAAASADKQFFVVHGARHNDVDYAGTAAGDALAAFFTRH